MKKRISILMLLLAIAFSFGFNQKAKAERVDLTYEDCEGIMPKIVSFSKYTIFVTIDQQDFEFKFDSSKKGQIFFVNGDSNGTIWINIYAKPELYKPELYWLSYELEGNQMSLHYFGEGRMYYSSTSSYVDRYSPYGSDNELSLPNLDELSKLLNNPNTPVEPSSQPNATTTVKPIPTKTPAPTPKVIKDKISKSKKTKTKVTLLSNTGKVLKTVKFNKKTGIMVYNKKKIKKVKAVYFTKKGNIVYITKSKKAYYFIGKKSTLIKSKVSSVKTSKGFATHLVIKKGKKVKSFKLKK